jgi:putative ABC transport system substrate-binding protein
MFNGIRMAFGQTRRDASWSLATTSVEQLAIGVVTLVITLVVSSSLAADPPSVRRIGYITIDPPREHGPMASAFSKGLAEGGYIEGKDVIVERRFGTPGVTQALIADLMALKVEVLVADSTPAALAAMSATRTIPIIALSGDPVAAGLVASLPHPGGNVTGVSTLGSGLASKRLALLKEMAPSIRRVALLWAPHNRAHQFQIDETRKTAAQLGIVLQLVPVPRRDTVDQVLASIASVDAIIVLSDSVLDFIRPQIGRFALQKRLPVGCTWRVPDDENCLIWYGPSILRLHQRLGVYAARILSGAKPADLPVEQPTTFALVLNAKMAKAFGIPIPESLLVAADDVVR